MLHDLGYVSAREGNLDVRPELNERGWHVNLVEAILNLEFWQVALLVILTFAGSSAASAFVTGRFESARQSRTFRRDVRRDALTAIGQVYGLYLKYGNESTPPSINSTRDQEIAERGAAMHVAVAAIGDKSLLPLVQELAKLGELFASQDEATSVAAVNEKFTAIITKIAEQIPEK